MNPQTLEQWREAVEAAAGLRIIADLKMYGLLTGGPGININRCDEILRRGAKRGVFPADAQRSALAIIAELNNERKDQKWKRD